MATERLIRPKTRKVSMGDILPNLIAALRLGELMMEEELTWQAVGMYVVFLALGGVAIAWGMAKAVRAWRDALK